MYFHPLSPLANPVFPISRFVLDVLCAFGLLRLRPLEIICNISLVASHLIYRNSPVASAACGFTCQPFHLLECPSPPPPPFNYDLFRRRPRWICMAPFWVIVMLTGRFYPPRIPPLIPLPNCNAAKHLRVNPPLHFATHVRVAITCRRRLSIAILFLRGANFSKV